MLIPNRRATCRMIWLWLWRGRSPPIPINTSLSPNAKFFQCKMKTIRLTKRFQYFVDHSRCHKNGWHTSSSNLRVKSEHLIQTGLIWTTFSTWMEYQIDRAQMICSNHNSKSHQKIILTPLSQKLILWAEEAWGIHLKTILRHL